MQRKIRRLKTLSPWIALTLAGCALLAQPAAALPNGSLCSTGWMTWMTGTVWSAADVWDARQQAGDICLHSWWQYPTTGQYTNQGCHPEVTQIGTSTDYTFNCVCCSTDGIFGGYMTVSQAIDVVLERYPGQPVGGHLGEITLHDGEVATVYHIDVQVSDGLILRVDVDTATGKILELPAAPDDRGDR